MIGKGKIQTGCFDRHDDADDSPVQSEYASPPCYMHEVDPAYFGLDRSSEPTLPRNSSDSEEPDTRHPSSNCGRETE